MQKHSKHATFPFKVAMLVILVAAMSWLYWFLTTY